jgi:hypothetical protein
MIEALSGLGVFFEDVSNSAYAAISSHRIEILPLFRGAVRVLYCCKCSNHDQLTLMNTYEGSQSLIEHPRLLSDVSLSLGIGDTLRLKSLPLALRDSSAHTGIDAMIKFRC